MDQQPNTEPTPTPKFPPEFANLFPPNLFLHADVLERFDQIEGNDTQVAKLFFALRRYGKGIDPFFDTNDPNPKTAADNAVVAILFDQSKPYTDADVLKYRTKVLNGSLNPNSKKRKNASIYRQRGIARDLANAYVFDAELQNAAKILKQRQLELMKNAADGLKQLADADAAEKKERQLQADSRRAICQKIIVDFYELLQRNCKPFRDNPQLLRIETLQTLAYAVEHNFDRNQEKKNRVAELLFKYSQNHALRKRIANLQPNDAIDFFELLKRYTEQAEQEIAVAGKKFAKFIEYGGFLPRENDK